MYHDVSPEFHVRLLLTRKNHLVGSGVDGKCKALSSDSSPISPNPLRLCCHSAATLSLPSVGHWTMCEVSRKNGSEALAWKNTEMVGRDRRREFRYEEG